MDKRTWTFLMVIFFSFSLSACYYFSARNEIKSAEKLVNDLKRAGGVALVPYEYTSAEKFLEISKIEFNDNDFKAAKGMIAANPFQAKTKLDELKTMVDKWENTFKEMAAAPAKPEATKKGKK